MVVDSLTEDETDLLFHALADATRRDIVSSVIRAEQSVSTLARRYDVSFAAIQKQVAVLERAALVTKQRRGREQIVYGNLGTISKAERVLHEFEQLWIGRADRIASLLALSDPAAASEDLDTVRGRNETRDPDEEMDQS